MSYFAESLRDIMDRHALSAVDLSRRAGRSAASIDSYRQDRAAPTREALAAILPHIPEPARSDLIIARLRDMIPEEYHDAILILPAGEQVAEPPGKYDVTSGMSAELAQAIKQLARAAIQHTDVRDLILSLTRAGIGVPPSSEQSEQPQE